MKKTATAIASTLLSVAMTSILGSFAPALASEFGAPLTAGQTAPDFSLKDITGKTHELSSYKGKFVVLEWFNDGCPFVKKHYESKNMQKLQKEYTGKGVVWLTINSSAEGKQGYHQPNEYEKLVKDKDMHSTAFLLDHDGKVGHLYGAKTTPDMYVIDKKGILVYSGAIDDTPSADQTDIPKSKNYVKQVLDEELAGKKCDVAFNKSYGCSVKYAE